MKHRRINWVWEDEEAARSFEEWVGFPDAETIAKETDRILAAMKITPPASVLDIGCGTGRHSLELARRGYRVVGIDVSEWFIRSAKKQAANQAVDVDFELLNASKINFSAEFDFALAWNHTLGFMSDLELEREFTAIHKALKPEGVFLLVVAGPKLTSEWPPHGERNWAESERKIILSDKQYENNYRLERNIIVDTAADQIIEFEERQRALSLRNIQTLLTRSAFADITSLASLEGKPANEDHFGVFICRSD